MRRITGALLAGMTAICLVSLGCPKTPPPTPPSGAQAPSNPGGTQTPVVAPSQQGPGDPVAPPQWQELVKWTVDIKDALAQAAKVSKPVMVDLSMSCVRCFKMREITFNDDAVAKEAEGFFCVRLECETAADLAKHDARKCCVRFFASDGKELRGLAEYVDPKVLVCAMKEVQRVGKLVDSAEGLPPDADADLKWALGKIGEDWNNMSLAANQISQGKDAVEVMRRLVWSGVPDHRVLAVEAMVLARKPELLMDLLVSLNDEFWMVRGAAARGLGALGDADAALYLVEAFKDENIQVRADILAAMGRMKTDVIIGPLLETLANPSDPLRMDVVPILAQTGDPCVIKDISKLLKDPMEDVRLAAVNALGILKQPECAPVLETVITKEGETWNVKHWALHALMAIGGKECTPAVLGALDDKDEKVRVSACEAVGRLKISEASARLMAMLDGEKTDMAKAAACRALGRLGEAGAKERITALASSNPGVLMTCAIEALCRLGDTSRVSELGAILKENRFRSWEWRAARRIAAHAIGEFGKKEDMVLLAPGLDDNDPELIRQTLFSLDRFDGKPVELPWVVLHSTQDASDPMAGGMMDMGPLPQMQERIATWVARLKEMSREQEKKGE